MSLAYVGKDGEYKITSFFRDIIFAEVWDYDYYDPKERIVMTMIYRQTIHFQKPNDRISMRRMSAVTGIKTLDILRGILHTLEQDGLIKVERSKGGYPKGDIRNYHTFWIGDEIMNHAFDKWHAVKEDQEHHEEIGY